MNWARTKVTDERPKVGLFGLLGSGNIGNDGSLEVVVRYLRERHPDAELDAFCAGPHQVMEQFGITAVHLHWNRSEYRTAATISAIFKKLLGKVIDTVRIALWVRDHDVVIIPGMGALEATLPLRPWGTPFSLFVLCLFGNWFGTKVTLLNVGANAIRSRPTRWLFRAAARRAYYLSYRDTQSREAMRRAGLPDRGEQVYPDLVFALPTPELHSRSIGAVGLGVMDYRGGNDDRDRAEVIHARYVETLRQFVSWLLAQGYSVRLLTGDVSDQRVVAKLMTEFGKRDGLIAEPVTSLHELMRQLSAVDVVVATRFHNVLCALKMAKPTLSVGYAAKNDLLMESMGLGEFCQSADSLDMTWLTEHFAELRRRGPEIAAMLAERSKQNAAELDGQFTLLSALLFADERQTIVTAG